MVTMPTNLNTSMCHAFIKDKTFMPLIVNLPNSSNDLKDLLIKNLNIVSDKETQKCSKIKK